MGFEVYYGADVIADAAKYAGMAIKATREDEFRKRMALQDNQFTNQLALRHSEQKHDMAILQARLKDKNLTQEQQLSARLQIEQMEQEGADARLKTKIDYEKYKEKQAKEILGRELAPYQKQQLEALEQRESAIEEDDVISDEQKQQELQSIRTTISRIRNNPKGDYKRSPEDLVKQSVVQLGDDTYIRQPDGKITYVKKSKKAGPYDEKYVDSLYDEAVDIFAKDITRTTAPTTNEITTKARELHFAKEQFRQELTGQQRNQQTMKAMQPIVEQIKANPDAFIAKIGSYMPENNVRELDTLIRRAIAENREDLLYQALQTDEVVKALEKMRGR